MKDKLNRFKLPIGLSLVGLVLIVGGIFTSGLNRSQPKTFPKESLIENKKAISVDVSGAVSRPGVYQLKDGSRIEDAIKAAGGFSEDANQEYISKSLNMAQKLSDGSKVYIPVAGDQGKTTPGESKPTPGVNGTVNINNATQAELEALPGIGPVTASKIISDRPYQTIDDLLSKKVVSQSVFTKIKDQIVLY